MRGSSIAPMRSIDTMTTCLRMLRTLTLCGLTVLACVTGRVAWANGADLPAEVVLQGFVKPEEGRLRVLVRTPLVLLSSFSLPKRGPGFLDLEHIDDALAKAAASAGKQVEITEDGRALVPTVRAMRLSQPSDLAFDAYSKALALVEGPKLPLDTDLYWNQGYFDVELEYPLPSVRSPLALRVNVAPELETRGKFRFEFLPVGEPARRFDVPSGSGWVPLDPRWYEASWLFFKAGFVAPFAQDRMVFLVCLVAPFLRFGGVMAIATMLALMQALTLTVAARGVEFDEHLVPALFAAATAGSILLFAIGNLSRPRLRYRWFFAAVLGALGGFGIGHLLFHAMQFAGTHEIVAISAWNVGVFAGELVAFLLALVLMRLIVDPILGRTLGVIVVSALAGHLAWHWLVEYGHALGHVLHDGITRQSIMDLGRWLVPALVVGGLAMFLPRQFGGEPVPSLRSALLEHDGR